MYKKSTEELEKILENIHPDEISGFMEENKDEMLDDNRHFMKYMKEKFKEKGVTKQNVFLKADISLGYGYKLLTEEKRTQQRDIILRICYAAEFSLKETQRALEIYRMDKLYARDQRDALIMTFFNEHPGSIIDINEALLSHNLQPLRSSGVQD